MTEKGIRWRRLRPWLWMAAAVLLLAGLWQVFTGYYGEEEKALRRQVRESVKETFPERSDAYMQTFGLFTFETHQAISRETVHGGVGVVLVHGLDDPGKVWQNLAPELADQGHHVWLMYYPNDQPVVESAQLLYDELTRLKSFGVGRISIVAHSMGGLVSREMLTRPDWDYHRSMRAGKVPRVDQLIMVGTPNHGSQMARFRPLSEVRDHLARLTTGEATWLGVILDGAGEAKIDLLPGSRFLTELNARPHPAGVELLVIAGIVTPWRESDITQWRKTVENQMPDYRHEQVEALSEYMLSMSHGLGDGLVALDSTRLDGVAQLTVAGTHLSMIRNITADSRRVPPAVPIIVEHLNRSKDRGQR